MWRVYLAAGLLCALMGGFGVHWVQSLRTENARLVQANTALVQDVDRLETERATEALASAEHIKKLTALRGQREKANATLSTATAANPDWAGQRVPDDVLRALGL